MSNESTPRAIDVAESIIADIENFTDPTQGKAGFANTMDLSDGFDLLGALRDAGAIPDGSPLLVTVELLLDSASEAERASLEDEQTAKSDALLAAAGYLLKDAFDTFKAENAVTA